MQSSYASAIRSAVESRNFVIWMKELANSSCSCCRCWSQSASNMISLTWDLILVEACKNSAAFLHCVKFISAKDLLIAANAAVLLIETIVSDFCNRAASLHTPPSQKPDAQSPAKMHVE